MWRRRVRALRTQRRAEALGVSPDKLPQDDVELGLFSFWDTDKLPLGRASSGKRGTGETKRHSDLVSEASSKKLRDIRKGTAAQQEAERLYRTGQHPSSAELLHHLRRMDSF
ncbi:hypothetical protein WJX75_001680 [Coccomyxa subellipsoidea]|uniref:Uncharacterized protein n=1 Tax=Coccomyxa subellipsoidea TaxID=248742 RepID=A0ABR2YAT5_9CHLO